MDETPNHTPQSADYAKTAAEEPQAPDRDLRDHAAGDGAPIDPSAETTLWEGRTHWIHFSGTIALGVLAIVLTTIICLRLNSTAGIFTIWLGLVALSIATVMARIVWRIFSCSYRLTSQRLFISRGIFSQTIDQTELIRVDDVRIRKSLFDRIFGLGSVRVLSTDATDHKLVIEGIRSPDQLAEHIRTNMRILRRKSLFVEKL
ncbi:MAG: PH domain-containing protein [Phycisphaerae bacterium]|nr:PH domain-containing protein [Phycisphaerae bacterium]